MQKTTAPTPDQPGRWIIPKFGPPSVLEWKTFDSVPEPQAGEALVRIIVAGIAGPDNIQRAGGYIADPRCVNPGFTPGYDFIGEIVQTGKQAGEFQIGDYVASMCSIGAHATHIVLPKEELIRIEKDDDVVKICALPLNYMTAWGMLKRSGVALQPGSSILIGSAAGGVGTAIAQLVRAFKLDITMIGTSSPSKFEYLRSLGVIPVDRHAANFGDITRSLTPDGSGVDVAYDAVGSDVSLDQSLRATKDGSGRVIVIGIMGAIATNGSTMNIDPMQYLRSLEKERTAFWSVQGDYYQSDRDLFVKDFQSLVEKVRSAELDPAIAKLLQLDDAVKANELLISGAGVMGKMEFVVDAELASKLGV